MAYIDKKATIKELEKMPAYFESGDIRYGIIVAIDIVKKQAPTADVVEVRHGKWIKTYPDNKLDGNYYCSNCNSGIDIATGEETPIDRELYYCPYCGAKMDGKDGK